MMAECAHCGATVTRKTRRAPSAVCIESNIRIFARRPGGVWRPVARAHNLVVDVGLDLHRDLLGGTGNRPDTIKVGTGSTAPASGDTDLETPVFEKTIDRRDPRVHGLDIQALLGVGDANDNDIAEVGTFANGVLVARAVLGTPISKTAAVELTVSHVFTYADAGAGV